MLYPINGDKPKLLLIPVENNRISNGVKTRRAADLDVRRWFTGGYTKTTIKHVPRLTPSHSLRNEYTVFLADNDDAALQNRCLRELADIDFLGNVIVVRQASQKQGTVTHLPSNERTLVELVVFRYVDECYRHTYDSMAYSWLRALNDGVPNGDARPDYSGNDITQSG